MSSTLPRREPRLTGSPPVSGRAEKAYTVDCAAAESRAAHILEMLGLKHGGGSAREAKAVSRLLR